MTIDRLRLAAEKTEIPAARQSCQRARAGDAELQRRIVEALTGATNAEPTGEGSR